MIRTFEEVEEGDFVRDQTGLGRWMKVLEVKRVKHQVALMLDSDITPLIRSDSGDDIEILKPNRNVKG